MTAGDQRVLGNSAGYLAFGDYCVKIGKMAKGKPQAFRALFWKRRDPEARAGIKGSNITANERREVFIVGHASTLSYAPATPLSRGRIDTALPPDLNLVELE